MCVVWWWKVLESRGRGGDAPQGSRRPRGGCHRELGHMHCDSAGPWQASASCRLRKGCPGAMSSTRTIQSWRGAPRGHAVRVGCASVRPPSAMPRPPFLLIIFPYSGYTFKHPRARPCPVESHGQATHSPKLGPGVLCTGEDSSLSPGLWPGTPAPSPSQSWQTARTPVPVRAFGPGLRSPVPSSPSAKPGLQSPVHLSLSEFG